MKRLKSFIIKNNLINSNHIGAAVSGGPDSVFMLYLLNEIRDDFGFDITVLHFNHKIREESDADALFVEDISRKLNLDYETESYDVLKFAKKEGLSLEDAARKKRYDFFSRCRKKLNLGEIALAHTMDDVAETFIMNMLRGSSLSGLTSMRIKRDFYIRPVCFLKKDEMLEYLKNENMDFRIDKSNADTDYTRNSIRLKLMDTLREYNPNIVNTIFKEVDILKEEDDYLKSLALKKLIEHVKFMPNRAIINISELKNTAIRRRVISVVCKKLTNTRYSLSFDNINRIADLKDNKKTVVLRKLIKAYIENDKLVIEAL